MNSLKYLMRQCDLSFRDLEKETKIDKSALSNIANGKVKLTETRITTFCELFGVSSDFLLGKSEFGIYLTLSNGFIVISKQDYETYKNAGLILEEMFNGSISRIAKKELEDSIDPLFNQDIKEQINKELDLLNRKQLEKVMTLIKEIIK